VSIHSSPTIREITAIRERVKRLNDCFGDFLVRVTCSCGTSRHIGPQALARIAGRSVTLAQLATRMRCSQCGKNVAKVVAVAIPKPRGGGQRPALKQKRGLPAPFPVLQFVLQLSARN
jgi:hypothetical protein